MKYTVQSSKYVLKNFIYLFPFAILPAIFLAISTDEKAITGVITAFVEGRIGEWTFSELFKAISVLNFVGWESIVFGFVGIIVTIPCVALLMALLEKHMRIGKRTFNGLWGKLNDNFLSTAGVVLLVFAIYELWSLLLAAFMFFLSRITAKVIAYAFIVIVYLALHVLLLVGIGAIYLWLPCMQITGFRAVEALSYSYQLMAPLKIKLIVAQLLVLAVAEALICVCAIFLPIAIVFKTIAALLYAGMLMIYCVRMQAVYFACDQIERADMAKYYQR